MKPEQENYSDLSNPQGQPDLAPTSIAPESIQPSPQAPKRSKKKFVLLGLGLLIVLLVAAVVIILNSSNHSQPAEIIDHGTHTKAASSDLTFGQNRAVNACNVMPESLYQKVYGPQTDWKLINEQDQTANVVNGLIDADNGLDGISCARDGEDANNITLRFTGFRSAEAAKAFYADSGNTDKKEMVNPQPVSGLNAVSGTEGNQFTVIGYHDNYQYYLQADDGDEDSPDPQGVEKLTAIAKQVVKNMDDTSISTRPSAAPKLPYAGGTIADACELFSSQLFEQQVIANDHDITAQYSFAKKDSPIGTKRTYLIQATPPETQKLSVTALACQRQNAARPAVANLSTSESLKRINDELFLPKVHTLFMIEYDTSAENAEHNLENLSSDNSQPVAAVGDAAFFSNVGVSGELTQLMVRKGTIVLTLQTQTDGGSCRNAADGCNASVQDYLPLAKALAAKLP